MINLWYKNAVIYCLDVETFIDSSGSGTGDFNGLADRLDHIEALGATCVWLLPVYPFCAATQPPPVPSPAESVAGSCAR